MINLQKVQKAITSNLPSNRLLKKATLNLAGELSDGAIKTYSKATRAISMPQIKKDSDALNNILEYGKKIRAKSEGVKILLDRNPLWKCDIPYQENNYYRMIGRGGYDDIINSGLIRPKLNTKCNYDASYFEVGRANAIYARNGGAEFILEIPKKCPQMIVEKNAYPHMEPINASEVPHRIWRLVGDKKYEIVHDSIKDVITRHPNFRCDL